MGKYGWVGWKKETPPLCQPPTAASAFLFSLSPNSVSRKQKKEKEEEVDDVPLSVGSFTVVLSLSRCFLRSFIRSSVHSFARSFVGSDSSAKQSE